MLFLNELGKILPSEFIPQLREQAPSIKLEGGNKDYDLPDIEDTEVDFFEDYKGFAIGQGNFDGNDGFQKKYQELLKEVTLLKDEHKSNVKDLDMKIDQQDIQI